MWTKKAKNKSYCRFENTLEALKDCYANLNEIDDISESEKRARKRLIETCHNIIAESKQIEDDEEGSKTAYERYGMGKEEREKE